MLYVRIIKLPNLDYNIMPANKEWWHAKITEFRIVYFCSTSLSVQLLENIPPI